MFIRCVLRFPPVVIGLRIKKDRLVYSSHVLRTLRDVSLCALPFPNNFIYETVLSEYLVENGLGVKANMPIEMHIELPVS